MLLRRWSKFSRKCSAADMTRQTVLLLVLQSIDWHCRRSISSLFLVLIGRQSMLGWHWTQSRAGLHRKMAVAWNRDSTYRTEGPGRCLEGDLVNSRRKWLFRRFVSLNIRSISYAAAACVRFAPPAAEYKINGHDVGTYDNFSWRWLTKT